MLTYTGSQSSILWWWFFSSRLWWPSSCAEPSTLTYQHTMLLLSIWKRRRRRRTSRRKPDGSLFTVRNKLSVLRNTESHWGLTAHSPYQGMSSGHQSTSTCSLCSLELGASYTAAVSWFWLWRSLVCSPQPTEGCSSQVHNAHPCSSC